jgi:hypothetical protein
LGPERMRPSHPVRSFRAVVSRSGSILGKKSRHTHGAMCCTAHSRTADGGLRPMRAVHRRAPLGIGTAVGACPRSDLVHWHKADPPGSPGTVSPTPNWR